MVVSAERDMLTTEILFPILNKINLPFNLKIRFAADLDLVPCL